MVLWLKMWNFIYYIEKLRFTVSKQYNVFIMKYLVPFTHLPPQIYFITLSKDSCLKWYQPWMVLLTSYWNIGPCYVLFNFSNAPRKGIELLNVSYFLFLEQIIGYIFFLHKLMLCKVDESATVNSFSVRCGYHNIASQEKLKYLGLRIDNILSREVKR